MTTLHVYVTPKSGRNEISGWRGGELLLKVTAPPEDGKANAAVCKLLAKAFGVPKSAVSVTRGETSRHKTVDVQGTGQANIDAVFGVEGEGARGE